MARYRKPIAIVVHSRTHTDRTYGNPYSTTHTTLIYKDGTTREALTPRQYDAMNNCVHTAFNELEKADLIRGRERYPNGGSEPPWRYCERNRIALIHNASEVRRERDL